MKKALRSFVFEFQICCGTRGENSLGRLPRLEIEGDGIGRGDLAHLWPKMSGKEFTSNKHHQQMAPKRGHAERNAKSFTRRVIRKLPCGRPDSRGRLSLRGQR